MKYRFFFNTIKYNIFYSKLFKDSFFAIFGNAVGNGLLLIAGIFIARFLGKDLYGEYGIVKTTMFNLGFFSTFGLSFTTTKYIAEFIQKDKNRLRQIIHDSFYISFSFSLLVAFLFILFATKIAIYLGDINLAISLKSLGVIIIFKSISLTQIGILSGFKEYKRIAVNNSITGIGVLVTAVILTYYYGLTGAYVSLLSSQIVNCILNYISLKKITKELPDGLNGSSKRELLSFSLPIMLQEASYSLFVTGVTIMLAKMASMGEVGIYTAVAQWNAVIIFIPSILSNVILSYLSSTVTDVGSHKKILRTMMIVNIVCTVVPFIMFMLLSDYIVSFYGSSFSHMKNVFNVFVFSTIFVCLSNVLTSELISRGKTWTLFIIRFSRDILLFGLSYCLLSHYQSIGGAMNIAIANICSSIIFLLLLFVYYKRVLANK